MDIDLELVFDVEIHCTLFINPATTRNPYNGLFGFVSVAGYIGTFSQSNKGTLAASGTKTIEVLNRTFSFVAITSWNYYWIYAVFFSGSDSISGIELASNKRSDVEISFESNKVIAKNKSQTSEYRLDMFVLTCL